MPKTRSQLIILSGIHSYKSIINQKAFLYCQCLQSTAPFIFALVETEKAVGEHSSNYVNMSQISPRYNPWMVHLQELFPLPARSINDFPRRTTFLSTSANSLSRTKQYVYQFLPKLIYSVCQYLPAIRYWVCQECTL